MVSNKEISILIFNNQEISSKTLLILEDWSRKGFLKNFLAIGNYQKDIENLTCVEYINGNINAIDDVQYRLSQEEYELIRIVTITEPKDEFDFLSNSIFEPKDLAKVKLLEKIYRTH